jgi:signal transduction histidine kinase
MASIMGFSELLLRRAYSPETARDMLDTIHRQATRLTGLLNELLDLARIEARAGKDFKFTRRDLGSLVRESVATALGGVERVGHMRVAEGLPEVNIDAAKLQQALLNILSNAVKYSPTGSDVDIDVEYIDDHVVARVTDHGIGMKPEEVARVFERFYRADPSGNIPGTGLGMSLVKEIVERHGGRVEIDSRHGQGTRVSLYLPAAEELVPEALAA